MAYRKVDEKFWISARIGKLSQDAKFLYLYLLTCPHNNLLTCYRLPEGYALEDLGWKPERLRERLKELLGEPFADGSNGLVAYDPETKLIAVKGQLDKEGMANPNAAKAAEKVLEGLPTQSPVYAVIIESLERLPERLPEPLGEQQEQEQEQEQDIVSSSLRSEDTLCSAPQDGSEPEPVLFTVPLAKRDGEYEITQAFIDEFIDAFPGIDVLTELKKLRLWNVNNSRNRKTRRGFRDHVLFWLGRAQDRAPRRPDKPAYAAQGRALDW